MAKFPYKNILEGVKHIWTKSQGPDAEGAAVTANPLTVGYKDAEGKATGVTPTNMLPVGDAAAQAKLADILTKLSADPATQTTLALILAKIIAAPATEAKQTALNALIGEVQAAPTANTLLARLKSLEDKIAAIIAGTSPAVTTLSGSIPQQEKIVTLANAVAITDTEHKIYKLTNHINQSQIRQCKEFKITCYNTHNQPATIILYTKHPLFNATTNSGVIYFEQDNLPANDSTLRLQATAGGTGSAVSNKVVPALRGLHSDILVYVKFSVAPTTGAVSIFVEMH